MAMKKIADLFGVDAPDAAVIEVADAKENTPSIDPLYYFDSVFLKKMLLWLSPNTPRKNLLLIGDGGVGKTSGVLETCARLGKEVWGMSCSGRTRFMDAVGSLMITEDGATKFAYGPLPLAMMSGGVFLANEVTRMDAGEQMRLVDVLDGRSRLTIPETGEIITPHPDFRFAATGNSGGYGDDTGAFAGEKRGSIAFFDRFIKLTLAPLPPEVEEMVVRRYAPGLPEAVVKGMCKLAQSVRESFVGAGGSLQVTVSPRGLVAWAQMAQCYATIKGIDPVTEALNDTVLNGAPEVDVNAIREIYKTWLNGG